MDRVHIAKFISGATKQACPSDDGRVDSILNKYDTKNAGVITEKMFL